jgi:isochorismate pyruvate lyase
MSLRKLPQQCQGLADIRVEVNRIDPELVALLAARNGYAEAAAVFKTSEEDIRSPDHLDAFFTERKRQAREAGVDEAMVERIFRAIVERSIELQLALWRRGAKP